MAFNVVLKSGRFNIYNSESGNSYTVLIHDDEVECNCKSFEFCIEPKTCKHIVHILSMIGDIVPDDEAEQN